MSFSLVFRSTSADGARHLTEDANLPQQVKDYVFLAIQGIVSTGKPYEGISVDVAGHLCDRPGSPDQSTLMVLVKPV